MKLLVTRPLLITGEDGARAFASGLTVEVYELTAQQILDRQAGIAAEPAAPAPATPRRRKSADAQT